MKKIMLISVLMMATMISVQGNNDFNGVAISFQTFYDQLSPYGEWMNTPEYGYVWRPSFDNTVDFRPYSTGGNWVYTDLGWTWVSDYNWGWAPFHYGRWYFDDNLGWLWIPGNEWAPAWVTWGSYNNCWGWAPMGPVQVNVNVSWYTPGFWWTFVPFGRFCSDDWYSYIYNQPVQITNITYITNVYYNNNYQNNSGNWFYGPRVSDVQRHLNTRIRKMQVVDSGKPGKIVARNDRITVYRPGVVNGRENSKPVNYQNVGSSRTISQKINRSKPAVAPVIQNNTRYSNSNQRTNVYDRQPVQPNRVTYQQRPQSNGFVRNTGTSNRGNEIAGNRTSSRPATVNSSIHSSMSSRSSMPSRASTPSRTRSK